MTKSIDTLVEDIEKVLGEENHDVDQKHVLELGESIAIVVAERLRDKSKEPTLRLSNIGTACERKLWYSINEPDKREPLSPAARLKFLIGDIWERLLLFLAKEAGHEVRGEQDEVVINGVVGHRDAVIDGVLVDTKSASTYSFNKFKSGGLHFDDPFGYIDQLNAYRYGSEDVEKDKAAFLVVDKTLGNIHLDVHYDNGVDYDALIERKREVVSSPTPPPRAFDDEPEGKSGNRKLGVSCSYCEFKNVCWDSLRTFAYSRGPVFLTKVVREPDVPEIKNVESDTD